MPFTAGAAFDRTAPAREAIRRDLDAGARAGTPGCLLIVVTAVGGALALAYAARWDGDWYLELPTVTGLLAYVAALWLVWKAGAWWAGSAPDVARAAERRLGTDVLQPIVAALRPGARYTADARAPARTLEHSRMVTWAPFESANHIRWQAGPLTLELFAVEAVLTSDSPGFDRHFRGLLAWAEVARDDDMYVVFRARQTFPNTVAAPHEQTALEGFRVDRAFRVISNWEPFARSVCTPALQAVLLAAADEGHCLHAAIASGRVWVGLESERHTWFHDYPASALRLLDALDDAHVARLAATLDLIDRVASALATAARDEDASLSR